MGRKLYGTSPSGKGRKSISEIAKSIKSIVLERNMLLRSLEHALKNNELVVCYQPQANPHTHKIVGVEALVRWQHPYWGTIPPSEFLPIAEEMGWIWEIDKWVMETACQQVRDWQLEGYPLQLAVNWSASNFQVDGVVETVKEILEKTQLDSHNLEIELTETFLLQDIKTAWKVMHSLEALGVRVALDNFGKGYSSFLHLQQFHFDSLKLDRSFMKDLQSNSKKQTMIQSIVDLGDALNLEVVVEGVETEQQLQILHQLNYHRWQGYLLSPPLATLAFTKAALPFTKQFISPSRTSSDRWSISIPYSILK
jgi:EAL domain-containing protein (putative c-di-GMP-specific phosphodiesterase class I)